MQPEIFFGMMVIHWVSEYLIITLKMNISFFDIQIRLKHKPTITWSFHLLQ